MILQKWITLHLPLQYDFCASLLFTSSFPSHLLHLGHYVAGLLCCRPSWAPHSRFCWHFAVSCHRNAVHLQALAHISQPIYSLFSFTAPVWLFSHFTEHCSLIISFSLHCFPRAWSSDFKRCWLNKWKTKVLALFFCLTFEKA